jgi:hypothetical protein
VDGPTATAHKNQQVKYMEGIHKQSTNQKMLWKTLSGNVISG